MTRDMRKWQDVWALEPEPCVDALLELGDRERAEIEPRAILVLEQLGPLPDRFGGAPTLDVARLYVLGVAGTATALKLGRRLLPEAPALEAAAVRLLGARRPPWLRDWAAAALEEPEGAVHWTFFRALERAGLFDPNASDAYLTGMVSQLGLPGPSFRRDLREVAGADPEILDVLIWPVLARGRIELPPCWIDLLVEAGSQGRVDLARLASAALAGIDAGGRGAASLETLCARLVPALAAASSAPEPTLASAARLVSTSQFTPHSAAPRLTSAARLAPITELDPLIDRLLALFEENGGPDDIELVLDAVSRLADQRPPDFKARAAPLRARAIDHLARDTTDSASFTADASDPRDQLAALALTWIERREDASKVLRSGRQLALAREPLPVFLALRVRAVCLRVAQGLTVQLLSTPTHAGGWLEPLVLVERAEARRGQEVEVVDMVQALLRLAPEGRPEALARAQALGGALGPVLRYALGGDEPVGEPAALWIAAARARAPLADDPAVEARHPGFGPDGARAARYVLDPSQLYGAWGSISMWEGAKKSSALLRGDAPPSVVPPYEMPTTAFHRTLPIVTRNRQQAAWESTMWPQARDAMFAAEARNTAAFLESQGVYWMGDWSPLLDPGEPLRLPARTLIGLGLAARHDVPWRTAVEALIAAIDDGRLEPAPFGDTLGKLLASGIPKLTRIMRGLREAARASARAPGQLREVLEHALGALGARVRRGERAPIALLEALVEWSAGAAVTSPDARAYLESLPATGKAGKLARVLLGAPPRKPGAPASAAGRSGRRSSARRSPPA